MAAGLGGVYVLYTFMCGAADMCRGGQRAAYSVEGVCDDTFAPQLYADRYRIVLVDKGSDEALVFLDLAHRIIRRKAAEDSIQLTLGGSHKGKGITRTLKREFSSNDIDLTLGLHSESLTVILKDEYLYLKGADLRLSCTEPQTFKKYLHPGSMVIFAHLGEDYSKQKWRVNRDQTLSPKEHESLVIGVVNVSQAYNIQNKS